MGLLFFKFRRTLYTERDRGSGGLDMDLKGIAINPGFGTNAANHTPSYFKVKAKTGIFKKS